MAIYQKGETIRLLASITDTDDAAADPDTVKIVITDLTTNTVAQASDDMTKSATGEYYYDYLIAGDDRYYKAVITATGSGGRITKGVLSFQVEAD